MEKRTEEKGRFNWRDGVVCVCFVLFGAMCLRTVGGSVTIPVEDTAVSGTVEEALTEQADDGMAVGTVTDEAETPDEGNSSDAALAVSDGDAGAEPDYETVDDDYFADAVFIGDSRTVGLYEYGGLEEISAFYASTGLTVYKLFDAEIVSVPGQKTKITVEEALTEETFGKIYLMIGINEMGTGTVESFVQAYSEAVEHLRELQPDAVIYIQSILRVTEERSEQGDYITNEGIDARNEGLSALADNEHVFYLDVNPVICDETGGMCADYTYDGVHLKAQYIALWKDFLKSHAIS